MNFVHTDLKTCSRYCRDGQDLTCTLHIFKQSQVVHLDVCWIKHKQPMTPLLLLIIILLSQQSRSDCFSFLLFLACDRRRMQDGAKYMQELHLPSFCLYMTRQTQIETFMEVIVVEMNCMYRRRKFFGL